MCFYVKNEYNVLSLCVVDKILKEYEGLYIIVFGVMSYDKY